MQSSDLRVALFSGNYNYVRDGANQALNRLVGYLLREGVNVRTSDSDQDDFTKNRVTLLAETRVAFPVWRPAGIAKSPLG